MSTFAILGTGLLGSGMTENLLTKGHSVRVWNRSADKLAPLVTKGAIASANPQEAIQGAERIHLVLAEDPSVEAVLSQLQIPKGIPVLDHSTSSPQKVAERTARLRSQGIAYFHAPVFMGPQNCREGTGIMLIAGPQAEAEALRSGLTEMTGKLWWVGERPELAAIHKLHGNALIIGINGVLGDVMTMGETHGLSVEETLSLLDHFNPGQMLKVMGPRIAARGTAPTSFALEMARKDVRLMLETGAPLQILPAIAAAMDRSLAAGNAGKDYSVYAWPPAPKVRTPSE